MNVQVEISTTKCWMLLPSYLRAFRMRYQKDLIDFEDKDKVIAAKIMASSGEIISDENATVDENGERSKQRDKFVSLLYVDGPITRNGGACSYGSRDLRDMMMENANDEDCIGHIFYINTPGGSAWAANDFKQAIDYVRSKNQPVIAYVDGMCCSAGMYLAALCDERYYMNPKNEIGCIGVMAAFYTEKDGEKNEATGETYHELYDPESFDKNKEMRDIANNGDAELLLKELAELGVEFRADVKKACPNAGEEHLHGKVFNAEDVKGILMDDQKSLTEVFSRVVEIANERGLGNDGHNRNNYNNPIKNSVNMKENYPAVFALLGVEEMQMSEGGAFLNEGLLQTLNEQIEAMQKAEADAKALVESLTAEKEQLTAAHQQAIDDLKAEHAVEIVNKDNLIAAKDETISNLQNDLNAKQAEFDEKANALAEKETELASVQASLATAENTIAERDQQVSDLNAQITELQNNPGEEPAAGAAPQDNGGGAEAPQLVVNRYVFDRNLSYEDNCKAEEEWNKAHGK